MSDVNIFFGSNTFFGALRLDATLTETTSQTAQVTKFPVESGFNVSDYVFLDPVKISITGKLAPLNAIELGATGVNIIDAAAKIEAMMQAKEPVIVVTGLTFYDEMVMTSRKIDRLADNTLDVSLEFEEIRRVESRTTTVSVTTNKPASPSTKGNAKAKSGTSKADNGKSKENPKSAWIRQSQSVGSAVDSAVSSVKDLIGAK